MGNSLGRERLGIPSPPAILTLLWLFWAGPAPLWAVGPLPADFVNVALPEFGMRIGGGYDYGLANLIPVEVVQAAGGGEETRLMRTPVELRLSPRNRSRFSVRLGNLEGIYFWMEAPRVHGQWHTTLTLLYPDGFRKVIFTRNIQNRVIHFAHVDPMTTLEVQMRSVEQTFKLSKRYFFTVSPVRFATWPDFVPVPSRNFWD